VQQKRVGFIRYANQVMEAGVFTVLFFLLAVGPSFCFLSVAPPPSALSYFGDGYRRVLLAFSYQNTKEMLSN
jgi:hypothetical protein